MSTQNEGGRGHRWGRGLIAASVALAIGVIGGDAKAQGEGFRDNAESLLVQVDNLEERYVKPALVETRYRLESRYNNGKVAYVLEDYPRASLLLVDVVEDPRGAQFESYREALYLLGESLYQQRIYLSARNYFADLVALGPGPFYQGAVIKLLEIAAQTRDYEEVEALYGSLASAAALSPDVNYMRGKTLYQQQRYAEARPFFAKAAADEKYAFSATYFRGVCFAAEGQLSSARQVFEEVQGFEASTLNEVHIVDLSHLALGRLAYEEGDYDQAIDFYQRLPRTSREFDRALYELTWTLVAQEKFQAAGRVIDIFLYLSNPDPTFVPKVKLLKADLHLRLRQYERSRRAYKDVVDSFEPVSEQLAEFTSRADNLRGFFDSVVAEDMGGAEPTYMPVVVQQWVQDSDFLADAKLTLSDLASIKGDIEESRNTLQQVDARLRSGARVESFPELAQGLSVGIEVESRVIELREALIEAEYGLLSGKMSSSQREQWRALQARADELEARYDAVPKTSREVEQRSQRVEGRFAAMRADVDDISYAIDTQRSQLDGVETYLSRTEEHGFSESDLAELRRTRRELRESLAELEALRDSVRQDIAVARQQVGVGDDVSEAEQAVRQRYREHLERQRTMLAEVRRDAGGGSGRAMEDIEAARELLPSVESRLAGFFERMNKLVSDKTRDLRTSVDNERRMLARLEEQLDSLTEASRDMTAGAAYASFMTVKRDFDQIIMRGDVGLIDVAWRNKEDKTRDINQLFEDRSGELRSLQESFEEIR